MHVLLARCERWPALVCVEQVSRSSLNTSSLAKVRPGKQVEKKRMKVNLCATARRACARLCALSSRDDRARRFTWMKKRTGGIVWRGRAQLEKRRSESYTLQSLLTLCALPITPAS